jgi:CelD/BcsL family acetyltransferase involved in cellulose biosynthesis
MSTTSSPRSQGGTVVTPTATSRSLGSLTVERHSQVDSLAPAWDELADRMSAMPWIRPGWIAAWRRAFGHGALHILVARRGDRLCGVLPLQRRFAELRSPTNPQTPAFCLLAEDTTTRQALATALLQQRPRGIDLRYLPLGEAGLEESAAAAKAAGYHVIHRTITRSPFVPTEGGWTAYERQVGAKKLRELRRRRRLLERQGELCLDVQDGGRQLESLLEEGFRVEASGWKGQGATAINSSPAMRAFYKDVARWAAARGWLRLAFLRLNGRALAVDYGLEVGGVHFLLKTGYDPGYRRYGPGMLLRYEMLRRAFHSDLSTYELLGTDSAWKSDWTNAVRPTMLLHAFAPSALGLADRAAWGYGRPVAGRILRRLR